MAIAGKSGSIYLGANKVAELTSWSLDLGADNIDVTSLDSDGWKEFIAGLKEWSGSAEGNFDSTDTNGQTALYNAWLNGTSVSAEFRLGAATPKFSGSILVSGIGVETPVEDKVSISFEFQGTSTLTYTPS